VAAHLSRHEDSAATRVYKKIIESEIIPLYSSGIIKEYKEVLSRKKFGFDPSEVNYTLALIMDKGVEVNPKPTGMKLIDMEDLVFYEVVLEKKEDGAYLINGNKRHFPSDPIVVTAAEFLEIIGETK
jgi:predicted nucleic acid-binding protein